MKLIKAIKVLIEATTDAPRDENPDLYDAVVLGTEALRYVLTARKLGAHHAPLLLEGETPAGDSPSGEETSREGTPSG